ncbi:gluconokinase [Bacillus siamensis]|uniref:gluconokinase n=1 Tax=Bacillus siamensis TaxID=659243 RepID=UPI00222E060E|nr:gluconokinase [Bacillus siamensis]UZD73622.1 gluconokinase [Bacillus siamensis]
MKETQAVIGLDIGTTSTKAVLFGPRGKVLAKHSVHYDLIQPKPAWAEQDPEHILEAVIASIRGAVTKAGLSPDNLLAIGISTAMHSLIAVDQNGGLLTKSIIWADNRSAEQSKRILKEMNGFDIYKRTGTPIHPMSPLSKIVWMREQDKETFTKAAKFISIKEYILHEFFGTYVVDYSIASATGLFRLETLSWDEEALRIAGIREDQLSDIVPTTHQLCGLAPEIAARMGIHADTPFIIGANDGVLANLGVGAIGKGEVAVTIGTSGAVRSVTDKPVTDEKARTFCYALTDKHWVIGGPTNNGGIMLRWLRDEFASPEVETAKRLGIDPYDLMIDIADKVPAGSDGLLFLPFLSGERAPFWNPNARGTFFGISLRHKREHFIRAVLEGVIMSVFSIGVALRDLAGPAKDVRASGGFARSPLWRQILSDTMGREVLVPESYEASALGAAVLALHSIGEMEQIEDVQDWIRISHRHEPNVKNSETYIELFYLYERLYDKLKDEFDVISEFQLKQSR